MVHLHKIGHSRRELLKEFGISSSVLYNWIKKYSETKQPDEESLLFERYYNIIDTEIKDTRLANYLKVFSNSYDDFKKKNFININKHYMNIISLFENICIEDLTWDLLCVQVKQIKSGSQLLISFYNMLLSKNIYLGKFSKYLYESKCLDILSSTSHVSYEKIFFSGSNPKNIYIFYSSHKKSNLNLYLNIEDDYLRNIIISYLKYQEKKSNSSYVDYLQKFVEHFEDSLANTVIKPKKYEDFKFSIFKVQYNFYKINFDNNSIFFLLKSFYIFIIETFELNGYKKSFFNESNVDKIYFYRTNFMNLFDKGYNLVYLNKLDSLPIHDKWLLNPNGYEELSTAIYSTEYIPLNFERVKNLEMRNELKEWFFYSNCNLENLRHMLISLFNYFEFVEVDEIKEFPINLYKVEDNINYNPIFSENNILLYRGYISQKLSQHSINSIVKSLNSFLKFLKNKNYNLNPKIFSYLTCEPIRNIKSKVIIEEDLVKITNKLKELKLNGDLIDNLMWIFFNILITTNFRPSEITNLRRDCIVEAMKTGEYIITSQNNDKVKMNTKTSYGKTIEVNPSEHTLRSIKEAIKLTENFIDQATDEVKKYIFIFKNRKGLVEPIKLYRFYKIFKKITNDLDLVGAPYNLYDCRHTYMTTLFEEAMKEGNLKKALIASGHKNIATTIKYYIKPEVKSYLEAFHKVKIGNVEIQGTIVQNLNDANIKIPNDIKEITVKQGCGYCVGNCSINENIDCLICRNFIVTLDRLPFFQESISKIDKVIQNEIIQHEKEHLVSIKKLYVGYITAIHSFMGEKE